jgi:arsenite-transporting ATPase
MSAILRRRDTTSVRLVVNPDRMVVREAMRTFTYLNLYGYLTDAVVVNRVFPADVDGYFAGWRETQREHLELIHSAFAPVPVLTAPFFEREVVGGEMLDRLGDAVFADSAAPDLLHDDLAQELTSENGTTTLRLALPFATRGEVDLKKFGLEVIVRVGGHKRLVTLPSSMAGYRPRRARLEGGALAVEFERDEGGVVADAAR